MPKKSIPIFSSEAEEGAWMRAHQDSLEDYLDPPTSARREAVAVKLKGLPPRVGKEPGDADTKTPSEPITLRLGSDDLAAVKAIAARKGLPYQTMLKGWIHEHVEREQAVGG